MPAGTTEEKGKTMATFSAAASDVGFDMFDVVSVDFSSNDFTGGTRV